MTSAVSTPGLDPGSPGGKNEARVGICVLVCRGRLQGAPPVGLQLPPHGLHCGRRPSRGRH